MFKPLSIKATGWVFVGLMVMVGAVFGVTSEIALNNIEKISNAWKSFDQVHSDKLRLLNTLHRELGYGGMIHAQKNFILRKNSIYANTARAKLHGANAIVSQYEDLQLDDEEKLALGDIRAMIFAYSNSINDAIDLAGKGRSSAEINAMIKVDDQPALGAFNILFDAERRQLSRNSETMNRRQVLETLRAILGYGGMIHNFKNFVLKGDPALAEKFQVQSNQAEQLLAKYRARTDKPNEIAALTDVGAVLIEYQRSLEQAVELTRRGLVPSEIDARIAVDDKLALAGLIQLGRQIAADKVARAHGVVVALDEIKSVADATNALRPALPLVLIGMFLWLVLGRIVRPMKLLTNSLQRMAAGDTNIDISKFPRSGEFGDLVRAIDTLRQTAQRQESAESALGESERRFLDALDSMNAGVVLWDQDRRLAMCNQFYKEIHSGVSAMLEPGLHFSEYVRALAAANYMETSFENSDQWIDDYITHGLESGRQGEYRAEDNRWFGYNRQELSDGATISFHYEITKLKLHERELEDAMNKSEAANRAKSEFLANMSHELRTPLNAVIGYSDSLLSKIFGPLANDKQAEYIGTISNAGSHLLEVINEILDLSSIEAGAADLSSENFELRDVAAEAMDYVAEPASKKGVKLFNGMRDLPCTINADRLRIKQILVNLLTNAVKFTDHGGTVSLGSHVDDENALVLAVEDSGIGMTNEHIAIAMTKFGQVSNAFDRENEGTGLGLPLTKSLVDLHGGHMNIISQLGIGTTVEVRLPPDRIIAA